MLKMRTDHSNSGVVQYAAKEMERFEQKCKLLIDSRPEAGSDETMIEFQLPVQLLSLFGVTIFLCDFWKFSILALLSYRLRAPHEPRAQTSDPAIPDNSHPEFQIPPPKFQTPSGASRHAEKHEQSGVDVHESRTMEGGRRAVCASNGDEFEGVGVGASRHADQHEQPCLDIEIPRPRRSVGVNN
jgi:hypothetical protein